MALEHSVGRAVTKVDAREKVLGRAGFAGDLSMPDMLHLSVLRSERPHAEILGLDLEAARQAPGVAGVWSAQDLPGVKLVGPRNKDEPVLCGDVVRRYGDPIAIVAAETQRQAQAAAKLIKVSYKDLPAVFSPEEALAPGAPELHQGGNQLFEKKVIKGDAQAALASCAHVIENTFRTQMIEHAYLEPEAGVAYMDGDVLTVKLPTKHVHFDQNELSGVLDMPAESIRVICATIGGYFGDKQCLSPGYYAAIVTRLTGRPARMVYSREESFQASTKRHPFAIKMTTGADKEGRLQAIKVDITADTGAYASYGPSIMARSVVHATGPYSVANVWVRGRIVATNNPVGGSMRGFGVPQVAVAYETQMDLLARAVGVSPAEIRRRNFLKEGDANASGQKLAASVGLSQCLDKVEKAKEGLPAHPKEQDPRYLVGWGLGATHYGIGLTGLPNPGVARLSIDNQGRLKLAVGTGDGGQGAFTTMAQIAAETLGVDVTDIELVFADTKLTPNSGTSTASRITYVVGRAVHEACLKLVDRLGALAVEDWNTPEVEFAYGSLTAPGRGMTLAEAARSLLSQPLEVEASFDPPTKPLDPETGQGAPYATYSFAVHAAQVAVDRATGQVQVLRVLAAHDVGRIIHPINVVGQVHGGVVMGLGYGLLEEVALKQGRIVNPGFRGYLIPSSLDIPEISAFLVECEEPTGPFGAKGIGEPALLPTAPAIHNAVAQATGGHLFANPVTPERVWRVLVQSD